MALLMYQVLFLSCFHYDNNFLHYYAKKYDESAYVNGSGNGYASASANGENYTFKIPPLLGSLGARPLPCLKFLILIS